MALNVHLYISAPKSFLPQQDTGQLGGFIRGDDGMSFQVMQPKIEVFRKARAAPIRRSRAWPGSSAAAAASTTRRPSSASSRSSERKVSAQVVADRIRRTLPKVAGARMFLNVEQDIRFGGGWRRQRAVPATRCSPTTSPLLRVVGRAGARRRWPICRS